MNFPIALCIVATLVCLSAITITYMWLSFVAIVKGPKGQLEERVAELEAKLNKQALATLVKRG